MAFNWGIGDLLAVTKLAWDIYHSCYLVAREAPDEFRQLVNELASLQGVLRTLRDDANSDKSFLDKLGENRKQTLERCLASCFETLQQLQELVIKYRKLGIGDGLQFWRKIRWVSQRGTIAELKSKVMVHTCNISLCMSSIGNSSLARIETSLMQALERQVETPIDASESEEAADTMRPLTKSKTAPADTSDPEGLGLTGLNRRMTGQTLVAVDRNLTASPDSTPSMGSEEHSEYGGSAVSTPVPKKGSSNRKSRQLSTSSALASKPFPPSPLISEDLFQESSEKTYRDKLSPRLGDPPVKSGNQPNVLEVVQQAMKELSLIRQREQSSRPLRIVPQDPDHRPDDKLKQKFQELADDELKIRRLNARDWLRVATWWLLKARNTMNNCEKPTLTDARGSVSPSTDSRSPTTQAYVDLLKASYILYDVILKYDNLTPLLTDENRKLFYNLSDGINEDFDLFRTFDIPEKQMIYRQNLNIWELLQPEEESFEEDDLMPGLENGRWITVEQEDAGEEDEQVLFRTFVNAEIGGKRYRMRTKGAPYMLLLSTKEGESEPKVTICNQSGTMCLQRDFTPEDITEPAMPSSPISSMGHMGATEPLPLNFGRMSVSVSFPYETDLRRFMYIPEAYFIAVKKREPRQLANSTETLLFKSSVEIFEVLNPSTMKSTNPRQASHSCDLRVQETTHKEGWRTSRRMVVSSSAGEKKPWCTDYFMPMSRVQISRDGVSRQVLVKWSDTTQERSDKTDGSYNQIYSYVYDDSSPNIAMNLLFRTQADATDFEKIVLQLSHAPIFSWSHGPNSRFVYDISDTEPNPKQYKGLLITHTRHSWKYSELYYMYRDNDYQYDRANLRIRFPQVSYSDYLSTHVDKLFKPDTLPVFSHCEKKVGHVTVDFDDEDVSQAFMNSLTSGHDLIFSRRVHWITMKEKSRFSSSKSNKGNAEVQLWKKGNVMRLVSRWEDKVSDKWITMAVPRSAGMSPTKDSNRANLPKTEYDRGTLIDMANLVARSPKVAAEGKRVGPISIAFETVLDREEFLAALEGRPVPKTRSAIDDLLGPLNSAYP